jgi:hypothetical protein
MAWTYTQNFDTLNDGDLNNQDSWSGDSLFDVQTSVKYAGDKGVAVTPSSGSDITISRTITNTSDGSLRFYVRRTSNSNGTFHVTLYEGATFATRVIFNASGNIVLHNGVSTIEYITVGSYSANTWYCIDVEYDCSTDKARARVDSGSWSDWGDFYTAISNVSKIEFRCADSSSTHPTSYIDEIQATPASTTSFTPIIIQF